MNLLDHNNYLKTGLILFLLSILLNGYILETTGPNIVPDSSGYIRVANNYNELGSLMENDYNGEYVAFTERMPLYPFILSFISLHPLLFCLDTFLPLLYFIFSVKESV